VFYWLPLAVAYAAKRARTFKKQGLLALGLTLLYLVPIRHWGTFQRSTMWDHLLNYFSVQVRGVPPPTAAAAAGRGGGIMYAVAPHGIVPYSLGLAAFGSLGKLLHYPAVVSASVIKYIPLFAHMLFWGGAVEANADSITQALTASTTTITTTTAAAADAAAAVAAVAITPGGIAEMFLGHPRVGSHPSEEYAALRHRKGFVRLALNNGATLVPVYVFGASQIFSRLALPAWVEELSRSMRASLMLFYGRLGLPIPYKVPLTYALGRHMQLGIGVAVEVGASAYVAPLLRAAVQTAALSMQNVHVRQSVRQDEVDFVHNIFVSELTRTFEGNKRLYGWEHKTLKIV